MRNYKFIFYECSGAIIIIISIAMLLTINNFRANHEKDVELTTQFFVSGYNDMETKLSVYLNVCQMIADIETVKNYAENNNVQNHYEYINLISCMKQYRGIFPDADGMIALSRLKDGMCITANETVSLNNYLEKTGICSEKLDEALAEGAEKDEFFVLMISKTDENDFVTFLYKRRYWSGAEIYFFINVDKNYFCPQQLIRRDMAFLIAETESKAYIGTKFEWKEDSNKLLSVLNFEQQQMCVEKYRNRSIYYKPSLYTAQMMYILADSRSYYGSQLFLLIALWMVFVLLGIVAAYKIIEELRRPMNRFLKLFKGDLQTDRWDFVMESVQKMIDKNRDLTAAVQQTNEQRKKVFLRDLIMGSLADMEIEGGLGEFLIRRADGRWQCILFEYDNGGQEAVLQADTNEDLLKKDFVDTAGKYLEDNLGGVFVRIDTKHFACMVSEKSFDTLNTQLVRLLNMGDELYHAHVIIAIGESVDDIRHINTSYTNAMQLLEQRYWIGDKLIFTSNDLQNIDSGFYYPIELEKLLIAVVLEGDKEKCGEILKKLLQINLQQLKLDRYNMTELRFAFTATVKRIFKQMNRTVDDVFGQDMIIYLELNAAVTPKEFENTVGRIFNQLCECNSITASRQQMNMVSKIVEYIKANYSHDISLNDLAEYCSVSQGHINRLLRENMNISFKEYLDKYRVKKAQEILVSTNLTVNEVSIKVGYNYTKSFISAFKKYAFMTPGEYKNKYNKLS